MKSDKIMNNEMIFRTREMKSLLVMNQVASAIRRPLGWLTSYYNKVLERPVNDGQTLHLLHVQLAFVATVFVGMPLVLRLLCLAWLAGALIKCREALREM